MTLLRALDRAAESLQGSLLGRRRPAGRREDGRPAAPHVLLVVENVSLARDHRLRKQATSLSEAGYDVTVICRRDPDNPALPGVRLLDYPAPPEAESRLSFVREYAWSWLMAAVLIWRVHREQPFRLVQVSGTPDIYVALALPFRRLGTTVVLDQRDLSPEVYVARYGRSTGLVHRTLLACERLSFRAADHVVTVNESLRDVARTRGGLAADAVTIVGNGPRLANLAPAPASGAARDVAPTGGVCVWVGVMGRQDGVDLAVRAVAHLVTVQGRTDLRAVFVGDGERREPMRRLAADLGITANVELTGWLGEEEVFAHLRDADVGLEPNLEPVVSPVKVMEYMACGVPFVGFDLPETRALGAAAGDYVPAGDVVALAEAVDRLLSDPGRRLRMGDAGRARVREQVAWEHQERVYLDLVGRLLASPRPARSAS